MSYEDVSVSQADVDARTIISLRHQLDLAVRMREAALASVDAANEQLEALYVDFAEVANSKQSATWRSRIGLTLQLAKQPPVFDLSIAKRLLDEGRKVRRVGWNGKGMWLHKQEPDGGSKMTLPYVYMKSAQGDLVPWLCSQGDFFASDWELAE